MQSGVLASVQFDHLKSDGQSFANATAEATGNAAAVNATNLLARVQGFLQQLNYKDGDFVKQGTTLFVIEPEPYKLKLEQAQAAEAGAQATLKQAEAEYERQADLASRQVASKAALDNATANRDLALAKLTQAQVDTKQAAINLGYTQVKAPFDGVVTARLVSLGELVGANGPTQLATIVQTAPIYVNFTVNEQEVCACAPSSAGSGSSRRSSRTCRSRSGCSPTRATRTPARSITPRRRSPSRPARWRCAPSCRTRTRCCCRAISCACALPRNKDNVVEQRKVVTGPKVGELRAIDSGLKPDDRVIVTGLLRAIPGQKVDPQLQTIAAAPAAAAGAK